MANLQFLVLSTDSQPHYIVNWNTFWDLGNIPSGTYELFKLSDFGTSRLIWGNRTGFCIFIFHLSFERLLHYCNLLVLQCPGWLRTLPDFSDCDRGPCGDWSQLDPAGQRHVAWARVPSLSFVLTTCRSRPPCTSVTKGWRRGLARACLLQLSAREGGELHVVFSELTVRLSCIAADPCRGWVAVRKASPQSAAARLARCMEFRVHVAQGESLNRHSTRSPAGFAYGTFGSWYVQPQPYWP